MVLRFCVRLTRYVNLRIFYARVTDIRHTAKISLSIEFHPILEMKNQVFSEVKSKIYSLQAECTVGSYLM